MVSLIKGNNGEQKMKMNKKDPLTRRIYEVIREQEETSIAQLYLKFGEGRREEVYNRVLEMIDDGDIYETREGIFRVI